MASAVFAELVQTEAAYVSDLRLLCGPFLSAVRRAATLSPAQEALLFCNCETLEKIHTELLNALMLAKRVNGDGDTNGDTNGDSSRNGIADSQSSLNMSTTSDASLVKGTDGHADVCSNSHAKMTVGT
eukprot:959746-Pleurochrysis_carterae.AAC.1